MAKLEQIKMLGKSAKIFDGKNQGRVSLVLIEAAYFTISERVHISDLKITEEKADSDLVTFEFALFLWKDRSWKRQKITLEMDALAAKHFTPIAERANVAP